MFEHAQNKCDNNKLYWGTFEEISIYNTLMATMDVSASRKGDKVTVSLRNNESNNLFKRVPLMLKIEVPSDWTSVSYGTSKTSQCYNESGKTYVDVPTTSSITSVSLRKN